MKLNIFIEEEKIFVKFANQILEISETSQNWNMLEINKFLINLAVKTPDGELIELGFDSDQEKENQIYSHIVLLFSEFVKKYNNDVNNHNQKNEPKF